MDAHILAIGDEILIGQTQDTNSHFLAKQLSLHGIEVQHIACCRDEESEIVSHLSHFLKKPGIVITSGGLGPTRDDVTKKAISKLLDKPMEFNQEAYSHIEAFFRERPHFLKPAHKQQAFMPTGVELLNNGVGTAQGMWYNTPNGGVLVSLPGVPYEFTHLVETALIPRLTHLPGMNPLNSITAKTAGVPETELEIKLQPFIDKLPAGIDISFLPTLGKVKIRVTMRNISPEKVEAWFDNIREEFPKLIGTDLYGWGDESLEFALGRTLLEKNLSLAIAESCTGGYIAHKITSVPGSSAYFKASVVAYANDVKNALLKVNQELIDNHGAVSEEVVKAMALGVIKATGSDIGIATSGIAGPGGATPGKPVGTIWIAWGSEKNIQTRLLRLPLDREKNITLTGTYVMNACRKFLRAL